MHYYSLSYYLTDGKALAQRSAEREAAHSGKQWRQVTRVIGMRTGAWVVVPSGTGKWVGVISAAGITVVDMKRENA